MLPGFRFLFAATLLTISLLVFGLGAAALLRASHERFASLPKQPSLSAVFTQTEVSNSEVPQGAEAAPPALAMLRVEQAPEVRPEIRPVETRQPPEPLMMLQFDTLLPSDRIATLGIPPRADVAISAPAAVEIAPEVKAEIKPEPVRVELAPEPPVQLIARAPPIEATPLPVPAEPVMTATIDEPAKVEATVPEPAAALSPAQLAALPEPESTGLPELESTGAIAAPAPAPMGSIAIEPPLINAKPIRKPPVPRDRPAEADVVAALPDSVAASPATQAARPVVRKRRPVVKRVAAPKRRIVARPAPRRPALPSPTSPFGASPFGT